MITRASRPAGRGVRANIEAIACLPNDSLAWQLDDLLAPPASHVNTLRSPRDQRGVCLSTKAGSGTPMCGGSVAYLADSEVRAEPWGSIDLCWIPHRGAFPHAHSLMLLPDHTAT